jgi:PhnB protein
MQIVPNLHFTGECEKAIELYEKAFKGKKTVFLRYKDADPQDMDEALSTEQQDYVYHAEMLIGNQRFILNDSTGELPNGINLSLLISFDRKEDVLEAFALLKDGATILRPLEATTYSSCFVSLVDRFGVRWELMKEN